MLKPQDKLIAIPQHRNHLVCQARHLCGYLSLIRRQMPAIEPACLGIDARSPARRNLEIPDRNRPAWNLR